MDGESSQRAEEYHREEVETVTWEELASYLEKRETMI